MFGEVIAAVSADAPHSKRPQSARQTFWHELEELFKKISLAYNGVQLALLIDANATCVSASPIPTTRRGGDASATAAQPRLAARRSTTGSHHRSAATTAGGTAHAERGHTPLTRVLRGR